MPSLPKPKTLWKHWDIVEKKIKEEMIWLRNNIDTFSDKERTAPTGCRECFLVEFRKKKNAKIYLFNSFK